jgi:hypothetical protein
MAGFLISHRVLHLCFKLRDFGICRLGEVRTFGSRETSAVLHTQPYE